MIITCPSCATRYAVDPRVVGTEGRKVRCARCGHTWQAEATPDLVEDAPPPPPPPRPLDAPMPPDMTLPALRRPPRPARGERAGWAALGLAAAVLLGLVYGARDEIVGFWPPALRLYETLGLGVAAAGPAAVPGVEAGLTLRNVASEVTAGVGGDVLWIRGEVANVSEVARAVPALQIALTDPDGRTLHRWSFQAGVPRLAPSEAAPFETSLRNPDAAVAKLEITVADRVSDGAS